MTCPDIQIAATALDEFNPHWWGQIDLETLDLMSCYDCICGQLFGSFSSGLYRLSQRRHLAHPGISENDYARVLRNAFAPLYPLRENLVHPLRLQPMIDQNRQDWINEITRRRDAHRNRRIFPEVNDVLPSLFR